MPSISGKFLSRPRAPLQEPGCTGFTLVEMIVVIVVIGIIAGVLGAFVGAPVLGFIDQSRRADMTATADMVLLRLSRDLRLALPNSIRTSGSAIELLRTLDGDRYRTEAPGADDDRLDVGGTGDAAFNTLTALNGGVFPAGARLAVYPLGLPGSNPYVAADGVMTPAGTTISGSTVSVSGTNEARISLSDGGGNPAPHIFPLHSPSRRIFLVEGAVSYLHDGTNLYRYAGYSPQAAQPATRAALDALANPTLISDRVESFAVSYSGSGSARRNAVVTLVLALEDAQERVRLMRQVHVNNSP